MRLAGALRRRVDEPLDGYCPIERALRVVGNRSAILIMREAFYGATRFDEFAARAALTDATTSSRLSALVRAGLLTKRPYRRPGERRRDEYVLTPAGAELMPALFALLQWANDHDPPPYPPALQHDGCGAPVTVVARCAAGHDVGVDDLTVSAPGPFGVEDPLPADP